MKQLKKLSLTLAALLITAVGGAWADEPKVYTTAVDMTSLKLGDILAEGFSLTSTNPNGALFNIAAQRGKNNESISQYGYGIDTKNITEYGANATFTTADGTYYPIDENGNVGNAWVVTQECIQYAGKDLIKIAGVTIEPPLKVAWNADTKTGNFNMSAYDVELTPIYAPEFTATFKAGNANTIQSGEGSKATVTVTEGTDVYTGATLDENGKLTPLYEGQTITLTAATGYKFRKVEVKKKELPKYADVVTICDKNADNKYLISSFFDGTNANITTITKEEAIALAEYLGGGNIRVVYEEYEFYGAKYVRVTNAAGNATGVSLSTTNTSTSPLYYVPAGN